MPVKHFGLIRLMEVLLLVSYYYSSYPLMGAKMEQQYTQMNITGTLSRPKKNYQNSNNKPFHHNYQSFGQSFPHHVINPPSEDYFKFLARTPKADQLTADFAGQLLINEKLGLSTNQTDYLAISFSRQ